MRSKLLKIFLLLFIVVGLCSCSSEEEAGKYNTYKDLNGKPISSVLGSVHGGLVANELPDSEIVYFASTDDTYNAVLDGSVEGVVCDGGSIRYICDQNDELTYFNESLGEFEYGAIFPKSNKSLEKLNDFNDYIRQIKENGKLDDLYDKWFKSDDHDETFEYQNLPNINGEFHIATELDIYPFAYSYDGQCTGFEIELAFKYCMERGYSLKIDVYDFSGVLAAISSGNADAGMAGVIYTEDRTNSFYFSDLYATEQTYIAIRKDNAASKYNNFQDLDNQKIGTISGSISEIYINKYTDDAKFDYYNATADLIQALNNKKVDAIAVSSSTITQEFRNQKGTKFLGVADYGEIGYVFPKSDGENKLLTQLNAFISECKNDGRLDEWYSEWFYEEGEQDVDYESLKDINGTIDVAVCGSVGGAACFYKDNKLVGMDIEVMVEFAKEYGYDLKLHDYDFGGMVAAVTAGKVDMGGSNITITEERKKSLDFSDAFYPDNIEVYVRSAQKDQEQKSIFTKIGNSIYKTFVAEDRYKLFVDGVNSTLLITFYSVLFGSILGGIMFFLFRRNNKIMNAVLAVYSWLISGMPTVVLLMVFFYIIFGKTRLDGVAVSIAAFTSVFSVSMMGLLKTCFMAIDKGQFEASYALGYSKTETIRKIILPEIVPMFFAPFRTDIINLLKSTAIVGYIAVQDLTKASDIVRSRTYEAFFPLIVVTIIYFVIGGLLNIIIKKIEKKANPKKRSKKQILKGIDCHD